MARLRPGSLASAVLLLGFVLLHSAAGVSLKSLSSLVNGVRHTKQARRRLQQQDGNTCEAAMQRTYIATDMVNIPLPEQPEQATVTVHFHVVTTSDGTTGQVTDQQLLTQFYQLNDAYENCGLQFTRGNTTRTANSAWFNTPTNSADAAAMKVALYQGGTSDLNVYIMDPIDPDAAPGDSNTLLGQSTFPNDYASDPVLDGLFVNYNTLPGSSSNADPRYAEGFTLVHEAGHWLGLYHVFQNDDANGDYVEDTPFIAEPEFGCPYNTTDPATGEALKAFNIMDYSDDTCASSILTPGQCGRVRSVWVACRQP